MAERRKRLLLWLLPRILIFAAGVAVGYYVRDREAHRLKQAYEQAVDELEAVRRSGQEVVERGRRAGEALRSGTEAAVDSARKAVGQVNRE